MIEDYNKIKDSILNLIEMLDANGLEINEDGDIVNKETKKLVLDKDHDE